MRVELRQQDHHALAHAAAEVRLRHGGEIALKKNAPVLDPDVRKLQPPQLVADQPLQPEQTRYAESHSFHVRSPKSIVISVLL